MLQYDCCILGAATAFGKTAVIDKNIVWYGSMNLLSSKIDIMAVSNGMLYYSHLTTSDGDYLYKISTSGGDSKLVLSLEKITGSDSNFRNILVEGKWIVATIDRDTNPNEVYYFTTDGKKVKKTKGKEVYDLIGEQLYYGEASGKKIAYNKTKLK
jgi:hypothetical protein